MDYAESACLSTNCLRHNDADCVRVRRDFSLEGLAVLKDGETNLTSKQTVMVKIYMTEFEARFIAESILKKLQK